MRKALQTLRLSKRFVIIRFIGIILLLAILGVNINQVKQPDQIVKKDVLDAYYNLPLSFIKNEGQVDQSVYYLVKQQMQTIYFTKDSIVFDLFKKIDDQLINRLSFNFRPVGMREDVNVIGFNEGKGKVSYFTGNDPSRWKTNISTYQGVIYKNIYDGIDLKVYGNGKGLETEFIVNPYVDPSCIQIKYDGVRGLFVDGEGSLVINTEFGDLKESKPYAYQQMNGEKVGIKASYRLISADTYAFNISAYDRKSPLVIDPTITYSMGLKGSGTDYGTGIAVDSTGAAYVVGYTTSSDFPTTTGAYDTSLGGTHDAFVAKIKPDGSALVFSTYLGGSGIDTAYATAIDSTAAIYVTGHTRSGDFPTTAGAYDTSLNGTINGFVTKIKPDGSALEFSTYLGGTFEDWGTAIAVDSTNAVYVGGISHSGDFPTVSAIDTTLGGAQDGFVAKIKSDGSGLVYSTYLGGSGNDTLEAIAVDSGGAVYVTGLTTSGDFPTTSRVRDTTLDGISDAYVTKIKPDGSGFVYSTYLGGSDADQGDGLVIDSTGAAFVAGSTMSGDFPTTAGAYDTKLGGILDVFVTKINPEGSGLVYSTYLGGSHFDFCYDVAVDSAGVAHVVGWSQSKDFPTVSAINSTFAGTHASFAAKVKSDGSGLVYSTYLTDSYSVTAITIDSKDAAYVLETDGKDSAVSKISPLANDGEVVVGSKGGSRGGGGYGSGIEQSGGGSNGLSCFVATATYESRTAPEVMTLEKFRDHYLLRNPLGCAFINYYHKAGPLFADLVYQHNTVRSMARFALLSIVYISHLFMNLGHIVTILILTALLWFIIQRCRLANQKKYE